VAVAAAAVSAVAPVAAAAAASSRQREPAESKLYFSRSSSRKQAAAGSSSSSQQAGAVNRQEQEQELFVGNGTCRTKRDAPAAAESGASGAASGSSAAAVPGGQTPALGGQTPASHPPKEVSRSPFIARIVTLGLRNLDSCHPQMGARGLVQHGENHSSPPLQDVAEAVRRILELPAGPRLICNEQFVFDCREFHEKMQTLRAAVDWGHCGLHPANVFINVLN